ncbi:hypothetical protein [Microbacterium oxydans]|uniref:hypothetical protein n=1 Tax=Microbacterium oxydans TaxID=82380 RepID=UPI0022B1E6B7|nr:hypothetical protein [Microbacterium oxydans]MCZ4301556.1 hypothetical protein [Microbacterium oxydans]
MSNAAHDLADILQDWRVVSKGSTVRLSRGFENRDDIELWRAQVRAAGLLHEVDRFLEALKLSGRRVEHYLRSYPAWATAVFAPDIRWNEGQNSATGVSSEQSIDLLRALGDNIDSSGLAVSLSTARVRTSKEALDDLIECLQDPNVSLSEVERRYVFELIASVQRVMNESSALGSVDLLRRVHELLGVMNLLAETLAADPATSKIAGKIKAAARRIVPYASFGAKVSAGTIGAAADLLQITAGS